MISDFTKNSSSLLLKNILDENEVYSIGVHKSGITSGKKPNTGKRFVESVLNSGLISSEIPHLGFVGTVSMLGSEDFERKIDESVSFLLEYVDNDLCDGAVIVAIPGTIKGVDGNDYFLGTYPDDMSGYARRDDKRIETLPIEEVARNMDHVPKEFILGVIEKVDGETKCFPNYEYFSRLSDADKESFFNQMNRNKLETLEKVLSEDFYEGTFWEKYFGEKMTISHDYLLSSAKKYVKDRNDRGNGKTSGSILK